MSARTFQRQHVVRFGWVHLRKSSTVRGHLEASSIGSASRWEPSVAARIADEIAAFYKEPFRAVPDPRLPRVVRGKGQRPNRRRPS